MSPAVSQSELHSFPWQLQAVKYWNDNIDENYDDDDVLHQLQNWNSNLLANFMTHALVQLLVGDSRATASQVRFLAPEHWGGLLLVLFGPFLRLSNIECKLHEIKLWTWNRIPTFDNETSSRFFWRAGDQLSPGQLEHCGVSKEFSEMPILDRIMKACVSTLYLPTCYLCFMFLLFWWFDVLAC